MNYFGLWRVFEGGADNVCYLSLVQKPKPGDLSFFDDDFLGKTNLLMNMQSEPLDSFGSEATKQSQLIKQPSVYLFKKLLTESLRQQIQRLLLHLQIKLALNLGRLLNKMIDFALQLLDAFNGAYLGIHTDFSKCSEVFLFLFLLQLKLLDETPHTVYVVAEEHTTYQLDKRKAEGFLPVGSSEISEANSQHDGYSPVVTIDVSDIPGLLVEVVFDEPVYFGVDECHRVEDDGEDVDKHEVKKQDLKEIPLLLPSQVSADNIFYFFSSAEITEKSKEHTHPQGTHRIPRVPTQIDDEDQQKCCVGFNLPFEIIPNDLPNMVEELAIVVGLYEAPKVDFDKEVEEGDSLSEAEDGYSLDVVEYQNQRVDNRKPCIDTEADNLDYGNPEAIRFVALPILENSLKKFRFLANFSQIVGFLQDRSLFQFFEKRKHCFLYPIPLYSLYQAF